MLNQTSPIVKHRKQCSVHTSVKITTICLSPFCEYYRELCPLCISTQIQHKEKFHIPLESAYLHAEARLKQIEKGILILKKEKEEKQKFNSITLPFEVKEKIESIRQIINQKISQFQKQLQQMYGKEVNMKLETLSQTLKKSLDFLKREQNEMQNSFQTQPNLKKYFTNFQYWDYQRKYYKSYIQQILQKEVKNFKEGFDDDNIMQLIVNFEINLKSIFSKIKQNSKILGIVQRPHLFLQQKNQLKKYEIIDRLISEHYLLNPEFIEKPYPKEGYRWDGRPQSVYYPPLDCFFIFGEGKKPSNSILKYEDGKINGNKKFSFVGQTFCKRSHFSTCLIKGEIFIIGGYNEKQGCMIKCQKMIVNSKIKVYLVSSLEQRSAEHTTCNYKDRFILKFGGTSFKASEKQDSNSIHTQPKQLYPQIYDTNIEQWRLIRYNIKNQAQRIKFGLYPLIVIPYETDQNKIYVFANRPLQNTENSKVNEGKKKKFQIKCSYKNELEMKITEGLYDINKRYDMFPEISFLIQKKGICKVIATDKIKTDNVLHLIDVKYESEN